MNSPNPIREIPSANTLFKSGDTLVVFGEVFERGYINGLIDEAKAAGLNVIYTTVGRRDENQNLRPLTEAELAEKKQSPLINIPLEAGFDLEAAANGVRPVDQLKDYGLTGWESAQLDWKSIEESAQRGTQRFREMTQQFLNALEKQIQPNRNIIFAHTMAGGFPRAKVVMPIANRIFKGTGARYSSSQAFWESQMGQLCAKSFAAVTAETFQHLIELSAPLRKKLQSQGAQVRYIAYGYHGNEVLIDDKFEWYSYSPYLQGFAKCKLEEYSQAAHQQGIQSCVFNVPEILTNSSSIFLGVEVVLYPLIQAIKKELGQHPKAQVVYRECQNRLKPEYTLHDVAQVTQNYLKNPVVRAWPKLEGWPQHNGPEQMELMRKSSTQLIEMHKDQKKLMTGFLSEIVFRSCGKIIFRELQSPHHPVQWIGHDAVAKAMVD